jgi:hypothetical protein
MPRVRDSACGVIVFEAFKSIANQHNFPLDIPSPEIGAEPSRKRGSYKLRRPQRPI